MALLDPVLPDPRLEAVSPAYRAFQEQVANPQFGLPAPPVAPAQVAYQQQPQAYQQQVAPQEIPPWLLPGYEPPGMGAPDREREFRADHIAREKYRAALLADTPFYPTGSASYQPGLDKETLWRGLKGAEFAQKALPFAFPGGFLVDKFLPEGKTRSLLSGFSPFEHARLDEVAHRDALIRNQGLTQSYGPGAVSDFVPEESPGVPGGFGPPPSLSSVYEPHPAEFGGQAFDATQAVGQNGGGYDPRNEFDQGFGGYGDPGGF
jgi:hypothetical protein